MRLSHCFVAGSVWFGTALGSCSTFSQTHNFTTTSNENFTISRAVTCAAGNAYPYDPVTCSSVPDGCVIDVEGNVLVTGSTNLSLSVTDTQGLVNLAIQSGLPAFSSNCGNVTGASACIRSNDTTPVVALFSPLLACANGTLSGCTNGPLNDGTDIMICGPVNTAILYPVGSSGQSYFDGTIHFDNATETTTVNPAEQFTCPAGTDRSSGSSIMVSTSAIALTVLIASVLAIFSF